MDNMRHKRRVLPPMLKFALFFFSGILLLSGILFSYLYLEGKNAYQENRLPAFLNYQFAVLGERITDSYPEGALMILEKRLSYHPDETVLCRDNGSFILMNLIADDSSDSYLCESIAENENTLWMNIQKSEVLGTPISVLTGLGGIYRNLMNWDVMALTLLIISVPLLLLLSISLFLLCKYQKQVKKTRASQEKSEDLQPEERFDIFHNSLDNTKKATFPMNELAFSESQAERKSDNLEPAKSRLSQPPEEKSQQDAAVAIYGRKSESFSPAYLKKAEQDTIRISSGKKGRSHRTADLICFDPQKAVEDIKKQNPLFSQKVVVAPHFEKVSYSYHDSFDESFQEKEKCSGSFQRTPYEGAFHNKNVQEQARE